MNNDKDKKNTQKSGNLQSDSQEKQSTHKPDVDDIREGTAQPATSTGQSA